MLRAAGTAVLAFSLALAGCGGKTTGDESPDETPAPGESPDPAPGAGDGDPASPARPGETPLGACEPGFDPAREPGRACPWHAEGRCYPTKLAACACICPRARGTTCTSGFTGDRAPVMCF